MGPSMIRRSNTEAASATNARTNGRSIVMQEQVKEYELGSLELGNGRVLRIRRRGGKIYSELLKDGNFVHRTLMGTIKGNVLSLTFSWTQPGDGRLRPPKPCPRCHFPMEHRPNECTNWLPNGTYRCGSCGFRWVGIPGDVDDEGKC